MLQQELRQNHFSQYYNIFKSHPCIVCEILLPVLNVQTTILIANMMIIKIETDQDVATCFRGPSKYSARAWAFCLRRPNPTVSLA
jgi:hypothetical protein